MAELKFQFQVSGTREMIDALARLAASQPKNYARALYRRAQLIMSDSKDNYVPVHLAALIGTATVDQPVDNGKEVYVRLGYGGPAAPYALAVHEHISEHSPQSWLTAELEGHSVKFQPSGRGPKYLEKPLLKAYATLARDLIEDAKL